MKTLNHKDKKFSPERTVQGQNFWLMKSIGFKNMQCVSKWDNKQQIGTKELVKISKVLTNKIFCVEEYRVPSLTKNK